MALWIVAHRCPPSAQSAEHALADGTGHQVRHFLKSQALVGAGALIFREAPRTALTPALSTSAGLLVDAFQNITAGVAGALANSDASPGILGVPACTARYLQLVVGQFAIGG